MLDQSADGSGNYFVVVDLFLGTSLITSQVLRSRDNRGQGHFKFVFSKATPDGRVVVRRDGQRGIVNQRFLYHQLLLNLFLDTNGNPGRAGPAIIDGEFIPVCPVLFQQREECCLADFPINAGEPLLSRFLQAL